MRLSESLRRGIMGAFAGGISNRFKLKSRRDILFFEDILANYIKECEDAGYENGMEKIAEKWMCLTINYLPAPLKKIPIIFICNTIAKKVWINLGLLDDVKAEREKDTIKIKTKNEFITRIIGKNRFSLGAWGAPLKIWLNLELEYLKVEQRRKSCTYVFSLGRKSWQGGKSKDKKIYDKLNQIGRESGLTLKDALRKGIFKLKKNNRIYFRGKSMIPIENTLFHLFSNKKILIKRIPFITYDYFSQMVEKRVRKELKLKLLKNILQATGWGIVKIVVNGGVSIKINYPPYGSQPEKDNWLFLGNFILGYLWMLDKKFKLACIKESYHQIELSYSK